MPAAGHRELPHTADVAFEAWAPTRGALAEQAVAALVAAFADVAGVAGREQRMVSLTPADPEDQLVALLDEVIYVLDVDGAVPVGASLDETPDGGIDGHLLLAPVGEVRATGAVPKAVTYHGLEVRREDDGWRCQVVVDV